MTPTDAAILGVMASFEQPSLSVTEVGIGAGKRDLPWPNIMRLVIGEVPVVEPSDFAVL